MPIKGSDRLGSLSAVVIALTILISSDAHGDGVAQVMTSKSIPQATVAVIDPESGTSAGGGTTDVRLAPGDIILFQFNYYPVPDKIVRGLQGYLTEYIPPNTEVVGIRFIDANDNTVLPAYPGLATDGCARTCNQFNSVPCDSALSFCPGSGMRNLDDGSIAQLYADTGIFYATDAELERSPNNSFLRLNNGILMDPEPTGVNAIRNLLTAGSNIYSHNVWDYVQVRAYGISNPDGNASGNSGTGNTPFGYGSPVAGPLTHYSYEATEVSPGTIQFNDVNGPWNRVRYPGSLIGTGSAVTGSGPLARMIADASGMGLDVTPANPLPGAAQAVRLAMGEIRVGEPARAEVALRVLDTPLDPIQMKDMDCAEVFGGDTSAKSTSVRARDNPWGVYLGSPNCVFLNLKFDLDVDQGLAITGDTLTYTLSGKNLSILRQTNVVVRQKFDSTRSAYISASGSPSLISNCDGDGLDCVVWSAMDLDPSDEYSFTSTFSVGGGGHVTNVMFADYVSDSLMSPGFETQAITVVKPVAVIGANLATTTALASAGGTASFSGSLSNTGTGTGQYGTLTIPLPSGWTISGSVVLGGVTLGCTADCGTSSPTYNINSAFDPAESRALTFSVNVPGGTAVGLYDVDLQIWASQSAFGGEFETYYPDAATVSVGQRRSVAPILDCPIISTLPSITGTTVEANGTTIRLYFNLIERASGTSTSGAFDVGGYGGTFGTMYGGLEVRASAQATGELESVLSAPCFVTAARECSDGIDNDGDGQVDFPADRGCSSLNDASETDVDCSDGIDNDMDGDVDWPDDFECTGPDGESEAGTAQCADGIDNDGDGATDGADACCVNGADRSETCYRECNDFGDNDSDSLVDFQNDLGCHSVNDDDETDLMSTLSSDARLLFVFDTSGSMNWNTCTEDFTGGDGSIECGGNDVACGTCGTAGCGDGVANDSRIDKAKRGLSDVVAAFGEIQYGLMRFHQRPAPFACSSSNASAQSGGWQGAGAAPCGGGFDSGDLLVSFSQENQYDILEWMDGESNYQGSNPPASMDLELRGTGTTPLAGALGSAHSYLTTAAGADSISSCRPYRVILITDGQETCGGNPGAAAATLNAAGYPVYVIGFAITTPGGVADLNLIASNGGTGGAIFVTDEAALSAAIADIIAQTVLVEVCDGIDNDCDGVADEGFPKYCDWDGTGSMPTPTLCVRPDETLCDGLDNNCDGQVDENLFNACGLCGPTPVEICDRLDNDCDGAIDEGNVCDGCFPEAEICDGIDNDCDGIPDEDEGLTRPCGIDMPPGCTAGIEVCLGSTWGGCTAIGPNPEICDGIDNDCDGVIDGMSRPCGDDTGICAFGTEICTAGAWGMCTGGVTPGTEICNTLDDDCDGTADEGNPDGGGFCGTDIGECTQGRYQCVAGTLECQGGVQPVAEICNNRDDDCDGRTDEEVPTNGPCGSDVGDCAPGVLTCVAGSFECTGQRGPFPEVCDGRDNDCDMMDDNGNPDGGDVCGIDTGLCEQGLTRCVGGSIDCIGDTGPVAEICNNEDDDCDGLVDEGNPDGGGSCGTTDVGECEFGTWRCESGGLVCRGETVARPELCDGLDNNCDGAIDEGDPEGGDPCGDDTGACMAGTTRCVSSELICDGAVGPTPEVCNGIDDDCDGVIDDGIPVGAACGSDEGECTPGVNVCRDGDIICEGGIGPIDEICDSLDNDCDGSVDELPDFGPCGVTDGTCMPGTLRCVSGREICVGGVVASPEVCDCQDNDCDGEIDEPPSTGSLCPGGSTCIECQCAVRCLIDEFGTRCPSGRVAVDVSGTCYCLADECDADECASETRERDDSVLCAPDNPDVSTCVCRANDCTFPCDGVSCPDGLICDPRHPAGRCVENNCRGLGCHEGQFCDFDALECVDDPCVGVACAADEACLEGTCESSCADAVCAGTERCERGVCVEDLCLAISCASEEVCNPEDGVCVSNECIGVACPMGTDCNAVTGDCDVDPCTRLRCPEGQLCDDGECYRPVDPTVDAGVDAGTDAGTATPIDSGPPDRHVLATGGGGCTCSVRGSTGNRWGGLALSVFLFALIADRRRRRGSR